MPRSGRTSRGPTSEARPEPRAVPVPGHASRRPVRTTGPRPGTSRRERQSSSRPRRADGRRVRPSRSRRFRSSTTPPLPPPCGPPWRVRGGLGGCCRGPGRAVRRIASQRAPRSHPSGTRPATRVRRVTDHRRASSRRSPGPRSRSPGADPPAAQVAGRPASSRPTPPGTSRHRNRWSRVHRATRIPLW